MMLRNIDSLKGCTVAPNDGEMGHVEQLYFDDEAWGVRYLVVKASDWANGRRVLISPYSVVRTAVAIRIHVDLTRQQVTALLDTRRPVSHLGCQVR
ncbi:PRC-barrel domain-containing protein [Paraburkholderia edwinii]|uniref:PRC-barrel domain-containing protein n=1 Tax=Paraburkholderia edwinii TaxID=2861782 RepID=A0ABX8UG78_9BURK|nr:PRC-barrel domain-containing protein [Paraburkholderia edwinii]QYD67888.1 PRC-barrel domain-containing protein [Paraburkholderia edwinii]